MNNQTTPPANWQLKMGAQLIGDEQVHFRLWAPKLKKASVKLLENPIRIIPMKIGDENVFECIATNVKPNTDYLYILDDQQERPDPVSRYQPQGVHGPSRVIDPNDFKWTDDKWHGLELQDLIIYELHVGTFTPEGTFEAIIEKLPYLKELGITAIELMPIAQFPGNRNWGYDGVLPYAPQSTYGPPKGLKNLINACHQHGLAVILDVVYNHLGPEGNYFNDFAPYFTDLHKTEWGKAFNFDGPDNAMVRKYFIENALYWLSEYHFDGLRLDAVQAIFDFGPKHFLLELSEEFHKEANKLQRKAWLTAETNLNEAHLINSREEGGLGIDAQWNDDFHHAMHAYLVRKRDKYFIDYGPLIDIQKAVEEGFVYNGQWSQFHKKHYGTSTETTPGYRFVICIQNHDQIANAYRGERLATILDPAQLRMASALLFCAPNLPMIFMGQEFRATTFFIYFISHEDEAIVQAVREGYRRDHLGDPQADHHDPQDTSTFEKSKIDWPQLKEADHKEMFLFYKTMISIRKQYSFLSNCRKDLTKLESNEEKQWMIIRRGDPSGQKGILICNFAPHEQSIPIQFSAGKWEMIMNTSDPIYGGLAEATNFVSTIEIKEGQETQQVMIPKWTAVLYQCGDA